ncbi:hypothetical protein LOK49_LG13G01113 [Camellia lanceoleosa]|uniref:Uncharacterized protein n=1 Tax=Camellia lanceoleosa TaxID=1840588 RepID=A0ACC0FIF9_9ERIC|nr:hypothetical protein LOK49_LG13G01113 [Camellia lanceoleosa]
MDAWITRWSDSISEWKGKSKSNERGVWISCMGVPFHLWSNNTFEISATFGGGGALQEDINNPSSFEFGRVDSHIQSGGYQRGVSGVQCMSIPARVCEEHPLIDWAVNLKEVNSSSLLLFFRVQDPNRGPLTVALGNRGDRNPSLKEFFVSNLKIVLGNGSRAKFWVDSWCNTQSLALVFPRLFSLSVHKDGSVSDFVQRSSAGVDWNLLFRRHLFAWEEDDLVGLQGYLMAAPNLRNNVEDKCSWLANPYGQSGGRWSPAVAELGGVSILWKDILGLADRNPSLKEFFVSNLKIVLGNGSRAKFWVDSWCNTQSLALVFPRLFSLSVHKDGSVSDFVQRSSAGVDWNLLFRRHLFAWEEDDLVGLQGYLMAAPNLRNNVEDKCSWLANPSGVFSVASVWDWMASQKGCNLS